MFHEVRRRIFSFFFFPPPPFCCASLLNLGGARPLSCLQAICICKLLPTLTSQRTSSSSRDPSPLWTIVTVLSLKTVGVLFAALPSPVRLFLFAILGRCWASALTVAVFPVPLFVFQTEKFLFRGRSHPANPSAVTSLECPSLLRSRTVSPPAE